MTPVSDLARRELARHVLQLLRSPLRLRSPERQDAIELCREHNISAELLLEVAAKKAGRR